MSYLSNYIASYSDTFPLNPDTYTCSLTALMSPDDSWVAKWQRISEYECLALNVH